MTGPQILVVTRYRGRVLAATLGRAGEVADLYIEPEDRGIATGAIHQGRIERISTTLGAAFVALAGDRKGMLSLKEAPDLSAGQQLTVQVSAVPGDRDKAMPMTLDLAFTSRYWLYRPLGPDRVTASKRLKGLGKPVPLPQSEVLGPGTWVLRVAGAAARQEDLVAEGRAVDSLAREVLQDGVAGERRPRLLFPGPGAIGRALTDHGASIETVVVDDGRFARDADDAMEAIGASAHVTQEVTLAPGDLADRYGIEPAVVEALAPSIPLPKGGCLWIEPTRAFWAVDVDGGSASPAEANRAALVALARQCRLRALGGAIAVDLITQRRDADRRRLLETARMAFANDPTGVEVLGLTSGCLLHLARPRRGPALMPDVFEESNV